MTHVISLIIERSTIGSGSLHEFVCAFANYLDNTARPFLMGDLSSFYMSSCPKPTPSFIIISDDMFDIFGTHLRLQSFRWTLCLNRIELKFGKRKWCLRVVYMTENKYILRKCDCFCLFALFYHHLVSRYFLLFQGQLLFNSNSFCAEVAHKTSSITGWF